MLAITKEPDQPSQYLEVSFALLALLTGHGGSDQAKHLMQLAVYRNQNQVVPVFATLGLSAQPPLNPPRLAQQTALHFAIR